MIQNRRLTTLIVGLIVATGLSAQDTTVRKQTVVVPEQHLRLRTSILTFLEPDAHVMVGVEWRINRIFSAGIDLSYIFFDNYGNLDDELQPIKGYKIRPEFRHYFHQGRRSNEWFVAGELNYKRVAYDRTTDICVGNGPNGCDFLQTVNYKEIKRAPGFAFKIGYQQFFGKEKRLYYELFLGAGFKTISRIFRYDNLPPNIDPSRLPNFSSGGILGDNYQGFTPHIPGGFKLGVRL